MSTITKQGQGGMSVSMTDGIVTLLKDGAKVATGTRISCNYGPLPAGAVSVLVHGDKIQPVGQATNDLIESVIAVYKSQPEIKLPKDRALLQAAVSAGFDRYESARNQDYSNDTGLTISAAVRIQVDAAQQALAAFDAAHPEIAAKLASEKAEKLDARFASSLNA